MNEHDCQYEHTITAMNETLNSVSSKTSKIHDVLLGDLNGRVGLMDDVEKLKSWRDATTKRTKIFRNWIAAVVGSVVGSVITAVIVMTAVKSIAKGLIGN